MTDPSYTNSGTPISLGRLVFHDLPQYEPMGDALDAGTVWRQKHQIRTDNNAWLLRGEPVMHDPWWRAVIKNY